MAPTIGIVGGSISGNKGAEAMVTTVVGLLARRFAGARFILFSPYYKADKPLEHRYENLVVADGTPLALVTTTFPPIAMEGLTRWAGLRPSTLFEPSRLIGSCDVLVDLAGISFSDGREIYLPFNVLTVLPAMMQKVPVVKLSQAMGPFNHKLNRFFAGRILPACSQLVARGQQTAENLGVLGLTCPVAPDVAFALNDIEPMDSLSPQLAEMLDFGGARPLLGLSPSSVVLKKCRAAGIDYVGVCTALARRSLEQGYRVMLLPHSIRPGSSKLKNNDLPVLHSLIQHLADLPNVRLIEEDLDSISLRKLIGQCRIVFASRFHCMVAALATAVPVMVCGWGHKYREILSLFGQENYSLDCRSLSSEMVLKSFTNLSSSADAEKAKISAALGPVVQAARQQIDLVANVLNNSSVAGQGS